MSPTVALSVGAPCARLGPLTSRKSMKISQKRRLGRMHHVVVRAGVEPASSLAIAQQAIAFAAVAGAEAAYTGTNSKPGTPGLPAMVPTLIGTIGSVASALLIRSNPDVALVGCIAGIGSSGYMMYTYINRIKDTPYNPEDWPGAKSWPAVMTLITFFIFMAYVQGITQSV